MPCGKSFTVLATFVALVALFSGVVRPLSAQPAVGFPPPPASGEIFLDEASLLANDADRDALRAAALALSTKKNLPVRVVTLTSITTHGARPAAGWTVSIYARALFSFWARIAAGGEPSAAAGDAGAQAGARSPLPADFGTRGLLILVSSGEKRVAVETGSHWFARSRDVRMLAETLGHHLERGEVRGAFAAGFEEIGRLADGLAVRSPGWAAEYFVFGGLFLVLIASIVSYLRSAEDSVAFLVWSKVFSAGGAVITFVLRRGVHLTARLKSPDGGDDLSKNRFVLGQF